MSDNTNAVSQTAETSTKPEASTQADAPTSEQQQKLEQLIKQALPKQYESNVTDTFNYAADAMRKMATSTNKEQTANEIAQDLKARWDSWVSKREADKKKADETKPEEKPEATTEEKN